MKHGIKQKLDTSQGEAARIPERKGVCDTCEKENAPDT
jgi:hypothetical protein